MLDVGVDLRDGRVTARHADPAPHAIRPARQDLDHYPNYIRAAYMAAGT